MHELLYLYLKFLPFKIDNPLRELHPKMRRFIANTKFGQNTGRF